MIGWAKTREAAEEAASKLWSLRALLRSPTLDEAFLLMPDWLFFWLVRKLKLEAGLDWLIVDEPYFAEGGYIGPSAGDCVPILIHPGEWRIPREAVEKYGKKHLDQINGVTE